MKVCFVLPRFSRRPIGGFKIVFEYANRLSEYGNEVLLLFANEDVFVEYKIPNFLKGICSNIMTQIEPRWFSLNENVKKISGLNQIVKINENVDVVIATGAETVSVCERYFPKSRKVYLIQGFETWVMKEDELYKTFNVGFKNIVVSSWLKSIVDSHCKENSILIKNPIDLNVYLPNKPIENRTNYTLGLLYHTAECKGLKYSIETIRILKEKYPDLKVYMFGTSKPKEEIPGLVKFIKDASQKQTIELYNEVSVFMCSSINEGYGLTAMEAMACGAAVVSTNYEGILEYGKNNENCLLSPVKNSKAMAKNIERLFEDDELRYKISKQGRESLSVFDWKIATKKFLNVIDEK